MADTVERQHPEVTWWCPQLPASPREAMALLQDGAADWPLDRTALVGSSLGGFYATWLAQQWNCPAVLLNPAVHPARSAGKIFSGNGPVPDLAGLDHVRPLLLSGHYRFFNGKT